MGRPKKKVEITKESIIDPEWSSKMMGMWNSAYSQMKQRTCGHQLYSKIAHGEAIVADPASKQKMFSEGSTQAMKRKLRAQTLQRVPDGEITTQFDKNSIEQIETEFLFNRKILTSEYDGRDMLKNLWRCFDGAYDYGFQAIYTGFEKDLDGDFRVSFKLIKWDDIYPAPDCDFIEEAPWYWVRTYISRSELMSLIDRETDTVKDPTYNADVVKYLAREKITDAPEGGHPQLADEKHGVFKKESIEVRTLYKRGAPEFVSWVPSVNAKLRTVKNYDPRKDVPIHFCILEPDPEFPLGCSTIMHTMAQQQFADAFQTSAYQSLLLAENPPLMVFGNLTNATIAMKPRRIWNMGTNPENKVEKFPVETTTITQYGAILQNVSSNMMRNLNITDATVASDANVAKYSATPQGVQEQHLDKTITVNQYQKRMETFFAEWANHALRSYIASMKGSQELTVDEETRRKIYDIEKSEHGDEPDFKGIINGDKIMIDFDALSTDMLEFQVRTGSLVQNRVEEERKAIQEMIVPISQMLPAVSDENRQVFEENIMRLMERLCELSNVDMPVELSKNISNKLMEDALGATMDMVNQQQGQIQALIDNASQQQMQQQGPQGPMPQGPMPQEPMPQQAPPMPMPPQGGEQVSAEFPGQNPELA